MYGQRRVSCATRHWRASLRLARFATPLFLLGWVMVTVALPSPVRGAVRTWDGGGADNNWNTAANWSSDLVPGAADTAVFDGTSTKNATVNVNVSVQGIQINAGYTGTVTHAAGSTLTVGSAAFSQADGTFSGGTAAMTVNNAFTLSGGSFTSTTGTLTITGAVTKTGGTFAHNGGTVAFSSSSVAIDLGGTETFNNVSFLSGTKSIAAGTTLVVNGLLALTDGTINTGTISALGNLSQASAFDGGSATIRIEGAAGQTFTGSATTTTGQLPNVVIDKSSGTLTLAGTIRTLTGWTYSAGTLDAGTSHVVFNGTQTISGDHALNAVTFRGSGAKTLAGPATLTVAGTLTLEDGSLATGTVSALGNLSQASTFDGGSAILRIDGTTDQTFTGSATLAAGDLPNVVIDKPSGTLSLVGTIRLDTSTWTYTAGTLDPGTSLVIFDSTVTVTGDHTLFDVRFSDTGVKTIAAGTTLTVPGTLTLDNGSIGTGTVSATGSLSQLSGFDGGSAILRIDGTTDQTFTGSATLAAGDLPNVVIDKPSGTLSLVGTIRLDTSTWTYTAGTLDPGTSLVIFDSTVTVTGDHTLFDVRFSDTGVKTIAAGTTLTVPGTLTLDNGDLDGDTVEALADIVLSGSFDGEQATILIAGAGDQTLTGSATTTSGDVANIVIDKPSGTLFLVGTIRLITSSWTYVAGTVDPGTSLVVLDAGSAIGGSHTLNDVLLRGGAHTVGSGTPTVSGTLTLDNGTIDGGTFAATGDIDQALTFDGGTGTLEITGSGAQAFTGSATLAAGDLPNVVIDKSAGTLTLAGTLRMAGASWTYVGGAVDPGTSVLVTAGTSTLAAAGMNFNDLTVNGGTTTLAQDLVLSGDLTIAAGTLNAAGMMATVAGDVTVNGTFTPGTGLLVLNGVVPQTLGGSAASIGLFDLTIDNATGVTITTAVNVGGTLTLNGPLDISGQTLGIANAIGGAPTFLTGDAASSLVISGSGPGIIIPSSLASLANLTLDNPSGAALTAPLAVNILLTLTDGVLDAGAWVLTIDPAATVTRTVGHVSGELRKTIPGGSAVATTFEIGDAATYAPVSLVFGTVAVSGTVTASTTPGEHPSIGTSVIEPTRDVNRWWSIVNGGTTFDALDATFTFAAGDVDPGAQPAAFVVAKWDGAWVMPVAALQTATSITATGISSLSEFAVGETEEGDLPDTSQVLATPLNGVVPVLIATLTIATAVWVVARRRLGT